MGADNGLVSLFVQAIDMEKKGYDFYIRTSEEAPKSITKKIFAALAEDENRHINAIEGYRNSITNVNKTPALKAVMPSHKPIGKRVIFGKPEAEFIKAAKSGDDELRAYEIAMQLENEGYDFYKKALEAAEDANAKELYKFLLGEEKAHYDLIASTYEYIKNPAAWFMRDEKPIVEG